MILYDDGDMRYYIMSEKTYQIVPDTGLRVSCLHRADDSGQYSRTKLFGIPFLLSFDSGTTNNQVHEMVWKQAQVYLEDGHGFTTERLPYEVVVSNGKGSTDYNALPTDDEAFVDPPSSYNSAGALCLHWAASGIEKMGDLRMAFKRHESCPAKGGDSDDEGGEPGISLYDCLDKFEQTEVLGENDMWYSPYAKEHVQAQKTMTLWQTPDILVLQLKRFMYVVGRAWEGHGKGRPCLPQSISSASMRYG